MESIIEFHLASIQPKARPRFDGNRALTPKRYRDWKAGAILALQAQVPAGFQAIARASVYIIILGSVRGDLDNLAGAVLDALVQAGILQDDRLSCVPKLSIEHQKAKQKSVQVRLCEY